ncbi:hypothetical protein [Halovulum sp. GXIMD14793]
MENLGFGEISLGAFLAIALLRSLIIACFPDNSIGCWMDENLTFFDSDGDCDGGGGGGD